MNEKEEKELADGMEKIFKYCALKVLIDPFNRHPASTSKKANNLLKINNLIS